MNPKLRKPRVVVPPTRVAYSALSGSRGANIAIPIQGLDPRVVVAVSVWSTRSNDSAGPDEPSATIPANVFWSIYSAVVDGSKKLRPLNVLPGFASREIRPADAWGDDGILRSGDSAEISASTPVFVVIRQEDIWATVHHGLAQDIWVAIDAYPSDALAESMNDEENREAYRGLLEQVRTAIPDAVRIATQEPG